MIQQRSALMALAVVAMSVGCGEPKPVAGKLCKRDALSACDAPDRMLACVDAHWLAVPCRGPKGCSGSRGGPAQCDVSVARAGDVCIHSEYGHTETCSEDHGEVVSCEDRVFSPARPCRGPKKCTAERPGQFACDETVGTLGEPCSRVESRPLSCSADGKAVLECEWAPTGTRRRGATDGMLRLHAECPTVAGCKQSADWAYCDFTGSPVGTPCGKGNQNREFCSPDGKAVLKCDSTSLTLREERKCRAESCKPADADGRTNGGCLP